MEAVPRMPMIWLDLKEAGEFQFSPAVRQFILKNYGENPDNYNEQMKKLETLRQSAVNVTRDFEGCSTLRKYFGQLHYLQSRVPMGTGQEAAVPISWTEIFSGKTVTHDDISYEQACILYNLGALHSMLGAMDNRVSEEGMKVSCTHFQCSAGAFSYLRDHFSHNFSVDMSHQILNLNINLMLGQAQECLLEKSMLDNRKSFLVARISAQVVDYYKEACRALENSETASMLGKIQKDWKKLVQMKIYYFASIAHLHMGKQAEEQQKYGERVGPNFTHIIIFPSGQPDSVQEALRFTMDVIGGKFNSAKKDNDFIYHETVPSLETLASVKGAPLVKALPVNPTDPTVTGPDLFAKLVPMAAHEASSLYSEEKAKLLRDVMVKIESKNETLEQFMDSLGLEPESVDNLDMYSHIPPVLMEKCAALSVRPDTVKSLIQSMQGLSGVFTDVESSLREIRDVLEEDETGQRALQEVCGPAAGEVHPAAQAQALAEIRRDLEKYMEAHEKASFTNTELHRAMNLHISNLRLLGGPLESLKEALPRPQLSEEEVAGLQCMKRILGKVQEMREQRGSLEKQLRDLIQQDDITSTLVTTERADMKRIFEEQLKKYEQVKVYIDQNLAAQENILKALTEANVQYASVRKGLSQTEQQWNGTVQGLVGSYEAYEDLIKKSQEGKEFYEDLETKASRLLERAKTLCQTRAEERKPVLEKETQKKPPARPTAAKPSLNTKLSAAILALGGDLPEELRSLPPDIASYPAAARLPNPEAFVPPSSNLGGSSSLPWPGAPSAGLPRFPANLPPPELLARIAQFPSSGALPRGPLPQMTPQMPPQLPPQATVSGYRPPPTHGPQPGRVAPTAVRPSTTTVDSIQAPIPSYAPTPHHPVPPAASTGYTVPPQMGTYPHFMPQPGMPIHGPTQTPAPQQQQQKQPQQYPQPLGQPLPQGYQPGPRAIPGPHAYPHGYMPPQPGIPQGYQTPQGYVPQQHPQMMPGSMPRPPQGQMPPQTVHPQMPPTSQPAPPASQPYMPHPNQQMPPGLPHQHMLPQQQQISMPPSAQQLPPHPHMQIPGGPRAQMPPTSQPMPPVSQNYMPPTSQPIHPTMHPQMPPASQPHMVPSPQVHLPRGPMPQMPPSALPPQHHPPPWTNSSTDDLLSSSPESQPGGTKAPTNVLQPTKADPQDGERRKKSSQGVLLIQGDPYQAPERVARLHGELERYRAQVDSLEHPSENEGGLSVLDARWKELQDQQEKDARQLSIAIARCYTMKNRHQDVMPYDLNRVVLQSGKDDYINASYVEDLSPYCPRLIATQAPLTGTAADFWLMVYEQKVSLIVMLVSEHELEKGKVVRYFPTERGQQLSQGPITLSLTTQKTTPTHVERMISLQYRDQSLKRTVVHLQFTSWPELGLPDSKSNLLRFIQEVHGHYLHQRPLHTPVVVHCSSGVGRTGAFCLLYAAVQELEAGNGIPDLPLLVKKMRQQRKNMLQEKLHLKFCYEAVLKHAEQVLQRHGITTATCKLSQQQQLERQESQQDLVLGGDMPISSIQATIAKLSIRPPSATDPAMEASFGLEEQLGTILPDLDSLGDVQALQYPPTDPQPPSSFSPPLTSPTNSPPPPNGLDAVSPCTPPAANHQSVPEATPSISPPPASSAPAPSSLELLATLTPEAFSMEGGGKGKQRVTKQSFLQPAEGQGLHGTRGEEGDDPLSSLDPLWSLNKH
uniref:Tyrosine-protein phosphatase non-receptor type 23 n=1 Tax=Dicentrarchus labrax TaxID=13489 RepID=A0A8C4HFA7_DICLA